MIGPSGAALISLGLIISVAGAFLTWTLLAAEIPFVAAKEGILAETVAADALLMLTDVDAVYTGWGTHSAKPIKTASPDDLKAESLAAGPIGPKVEAACSFVGRTGGQAGIGRLEGALAILDGKAGTVVRA